jgi:hypothetical protein
MFEWVICGMWAVYQVAIVAKIGVPNFATEQLGQILGDFG